MIETIPDELMKPSPQPKAGSAVSSSLTVKDLVFSEFLTADTTPEELAVKHNVSLFEVLAWFRKNDWLAKKRSLLGVIRDVQDERYRNLVATERVRVAISQLQIGERVEDLVNSALKKAMDDSGECFLAPRDIKNLADAAAVATSIRAKVVGLTEKAAADAAVTADPNGQGRQALMRLDAKPIPRDITDEVVIEDGAAKEDDSESKRQVGHGAESGERVQGGAQQDAGAAPVQAPA